MKKIFALTSLCVLLAHSGFCQSGIKYPDCKTGGAGGSLMVYDDKLDGTLGHHPWMTLQEGSSCGEVLMVVEGEVDSCAVYTLNDVAGRTATNGRTLLWEGNAYDKGTFMTLFRGIVPKDYVRIEQEVMTDGIFGGKNPPKAIHLIIGTAKGESVMVVSACKCMSEN